ncbi:hypothetical protein SUGI_0111640 [Cryptomeria japonica]|uniref:pectinesterase-like n=1 Tax=Cryptomeria japonica TaxID=3369 RepID=UPI002408A459|nr:pectinesterase-like [Cryptomeria japonica]GLJ09550.1 hypothetical protein SUGI_0111640 [Cryptomeria japonica]
MATYRLFILILLISVWFSKIHSYNLQSACELAEDPKSCLSSLLQHPSSLRASPKNITKIALYRSLSKVQRVKDLIPPLGWVGRAFDAKLSSAIGHCLNFYDLAIQNLKDAQIRLSRSSSFYDLKWSHAVHIQTLLSAAQTDQRTCERALHHANVDFSEFTFTNGMHSASKAVGDSMAVVKKLWILNRAPIHHKRRLLSDGYDLGLVEDGFPWWASRSERRKLLQTFESSRTDATVAQDGSGDYTTIAAAINAVPVNNPHRYVIRIKRGVYRENIQVPREKPNIMLVGDGVDATVITSSKGTGDGYGFLDTPALVVYSNGFVARDITFQNTAGPAKEVGVALMVVSNNAAVYRCKLEGFQDTLYAHSMRQFYRECEIYGTIDFICGNAAAVFQKCKIYVRTPLQGQQNVITAQEREIPNENTAIVIDNCQVNQDTEVQTLSGGSVATYLGRPWGHYSRTVYINTYLGGFIDPDGWFPWGNRDDSQTVFYGEYNNKGPGADTSRRCKWPGFHVLTSPSSVAPFSASALLQLEDWLPSGIPADQDT